MRKLTAGQKEKLDKFIESCKSKMYWDYDTWHEAPYTIPDDAVSGPGPGVTSLIYGEYARRSIIKR